MVQIHWLPHYHAYRHLDVWESGAVAQWFKLPHRSFSKYISPVLTSSCSSQCFTTGRDKSVYSWRNGSSEGSLMVDPLSYFSFQPVLHDWCNKGCGMCYPVCGGAYKKNLAVAQVLETGFLSPYPSGPLPYV